jgi:glycosyltransferase involved in cell wall biosynthesis
MAKPAILYVSYDGMLEPLGQSQVLAYLERLAAEYDIVIISFEKPGDLKDGASFNDLRRRLTGLGIDWRPKTYTKWPPVVSTRWDMARGMVAATLAAHEKKVRIFHARNVLCAAMMFPAVKLRRGKFLVDIRGFWVDERVDGGIIAADGAIYHVLKRIERQMLRSADLIVTLTEASIEHLRRDPGFGHPRAPIKVITTCADLDLFRPSEEEPATDRSHFVFGYVGQIGTWYLFEEMVELFKLIRERVPSSTMLIVNRSQHGLVAEKLARAGIPASDYELASATRQEVPQHIRCMTAAAAIIAPCYSKISSAPTKLAEYLGCGVPCIGNAGVGDVGRILTEERVGVTLDSLDETGRRDAVASLFALLEDPSLSGRCREVARKRFSLEAGVTSYRAIYRQLVADELKP